MAYVRMRDGREFTIEDRAELIAYYRGEGADVSVGDEGQPVPPYTYEGDTLVEGGDGSGLLEQADAVASAQVVDDPDELAALAGADDEAAADPLGPQHAANDEGGQG